MLLDHFVPSSVEAERAARFQHKMNTSCKGSADIIHHHSSHIILWSFLPKGKAQIRNVEFFHSGQEGWTDYYDPRYSVAFLNLGEVQQHTYKYQCLKKLETMVVVESVLGPLSWTLTWGISNYISSMFLLMFCLRICNQTIVSTKLLISVETFQYLV